MKITQTRNATVIIEYENKKFLIDPWLMPKGYMEGFVGAYNADVRQPRVELPFEIEKIVDVDAVIITHLHPDHWDEFAEKSIDKNVKIFVQNEFNKEYILKKGFLNVEILAYEGTKFQDITLFKTKTEHGKKEIIKPICEKMGMEYDAMGVIFKSNNEKTLYIAGDSIWCNEIKTTIEKFNPDVILLNACAAMVLGGERLIMNIEDVNETIKTAPNASIIISHMDTVSHLTLTRKDYIEFKNKNNLKNFFIPKDGEEMRF